MTRSELFWRKDTLAADIMLEGIRSSIARSVRVLRHRYRCGYHNQTPALLVQIKSIQVK
jgi:hypothetical protein